MPNKNNKNRINVLQKLYRLEREIIFIIEKQIKLFSMQKS